MQKQPSKGFFKESVMRNCAEFTRKHLSRNLFFDKVKLSRSSTSLKVSLWRSCELCKNCKNIFLQNTTGRLLLIIAVPIKLVKGELANENLNYDKKTKVYVPIWARSVSYQQRTVLVKFEQVSEAVVGKCSSKCVWRHFLIKLQP